MVQLLPRILSPEKSKQRGQLWLAGEGEKRKRKKGGQGRSEEAGSGKEGEADRGGGGGGRIGKMGKDGVGKW